MTNNDLENKLREIGSPEPPADLLSKLESQLPSNKPELKNRNAKLGRRLALAGSAAALVILAGVIAWSNTEPSDAPGIQTRVTSAVNWNKTEPENVMHWSPTLFSSQAGNRGTADAGGRNSGRNLLRGSAAWKKAHQPADGLAMKKSTAGNGGNVSLTIFNQHDYGQPICNNWHQVIEQELSGLRIQLSALIRVRDTQSANVCIQCWSQDAGELLAFESTEIFQGTKTRQRAVCRAIDVPKETAFVVVRAVMTGTGQAWFDDLRLDVMPQEEGKSADQEIEEHEPSDIPIALQQQIGGEIRNHYLIEKDCLILSYMPDWDHGQVDHMAVADNQGGVRTLVDWEPVLDVDLEDESHRFYLALYSRTSTAGSDNRELQARPIVEEWPENTSWRTKPDVVEAESELKTKLTDGSGWKIFDVTEQVRQQADNHGVMLSFVREQPGATLEGAPLPSQSWSGYALVSRQAEGELLSKRPMLLVVVPGDETAEKEEVEAATEVGTEKQEEEVDQEVAKWIDQMGKPHDEQFEALNKLMRLGKRSIQPARKLLNDKNEQLNRRWQAAMILGRNGDEEAMNDMLTVLSEKDSEVTVLQRVVVESLLNRADEDINRKLVALQDDPNTTEFLKTHLRKVLSDPKSNPLLDDPWESQFTWLPSHEAALKEAKDNSKLVMTIVYANETRDSQSNAGRGIDPSALPFHILLRGPFVDPDLKQLLDNHFAMRKIAFHIHQFSKDVDHNPAADPLRALQTNTRETQPPAILIHNSDGELLQRINAIGVFNTRLLHAAFANTLMAEKPKTDPSSMIHIPKNFPAEHHDAWAKAKLDYLGGEQAGRAMESMRTLLSSLEDRKLQALCHLQLGRFLHHKGQMDSAIIELEAAVDAGAEEDHLGEALFWLLDCDLTGQQHADAVKAVRAFRSKYVNSIWSLKLEQRISIVELVMSSAESFEMLDLEQFLGSSLDDLEASPSLLETVPLALKYLIGAQEKDGNWPPTEGRSRSFTQPAITAICASALRQWRTDHDENNNVKFSPDTISQMERAEQLATEALTRFAHKKSNHGSGKNYHDVWNQTYALEYLLKVFEGNPGDEKLKATVQHLIDLIIDVQYEEGGWSYLPPRPIDELGGIRPHSFNTAPILIELVKAKRSGLDVGQDIIDRALSSLESVRSAEETFAYAPARGFQWMTKQSCGIARDPLCELALHAAGKDNLDSIRKSLERFQEHRQDLDIPRKLYASYFNSNGHGAYFYAFAYFYAAEAIPLLPESRRKDVASFLQNDLLATVELDGTWIDSHAYGKPYATGMILRALSNTRRAIETGNDE